MANLMKPPQKKTGAEAHGQDQKSSPLGTAQAKAAKVSLDGSCRCVAFA
jgi:hypothetical protein